MICKVDCGLGSPRNLAPELARQKFIEVMNQEGGLGYAPINGDREAREAVVWWKQHQFGVQGLDPDANVTFAEGSRLLLVAAIEAFFKSGDEVVLPQRYYNGHMDALLKFKLRPLLVPMSSSAEYVAGIEDLYKQGSRPKGIISCFVHNPTGISCDRQDYEELVTLVQKHGGIILDDYAYGSLDFKQGYVPSILSVPGALDVCLFFSTASKMFSAAGWKVGFCIGRPDRIALLNEVKKIYSEGGSRPGQLAFATALLQCGGYVDFIRETYRSRAKFTTAQLADIGFDIQMPQGGMFGWYAVPNGYEGGSVRLTAELAKFGVIVRDDRVYGGNGSHIRWCFRNNYRDTYYACQVVADVLRRG